MGSFISKANGVIDMTSQENPYSFIVILIIFSLVFYFIVLRPQQKKNKIRKKMIDSISQGDEVLTAGGLIGCVNKVINTNYIIIALNANVEVKIKRDFITAVLPKGTMKSM